MQGSFFQGNGLAQEKVNYVLITTGLSAEQWSDTPPASHDMRQSKTEGFRLACYALAKKRQLTRLRKVPRYKPWGVQIAADRNKSGARAQFKQRTASCRGGVAGEKLDVI